MVKLHTKLVLAVLLSASVIATYMAIAGTYQ